MESIGEALEVLCERGAVSSGFGGRSAGRFSSTGPNRAWDRDAAAFAELVRAAPSVLLLRRRVESSGGTTDA